MNHMIKMVSNEECRLQLTELATEVQKTGIAIGVHPAGGKPRYQLVAEVALEPDRVRSSVRVGPDRFRRYFSDIRGLAFFDDIPFALIIRGQLTAVFQRNPAFRPVIADAFRAEFASRQGKAAPDLAGRVSELEARLEAMNARLDEQSALGSNRPKRPTPYKRPPG
jgi:hypothetical protein